MKNLLIALLCLPFFASGQTEISDKTQSPYFMVNGADPSLDALPLKSTRADVRIAGVIADVVVTQTYVNNGSKALEAIYVFPGSTRAAVYGMSMQIGQRIITAKIAEREKARAQYEQAKTDGKRASLLEQKRPNVFQMNLANIMPGDTVCTILRYTELLIPESGVYEFVYPSVVGPRYTNGVSSNNRGFTAIPYLKSDAQAPYKFEMFAHVNAGMPLQEITSSSHFIAITDRGKDGCDVQLDPFASFGGNRDFILRYALRGNQIRSGLLLYDDGKEKFFLAMAQPPKQTARENIPPREYVFVVDVSGSMNGFPLAVAKKLLRNLVASIRPTDMFNIILFAGASNTLSPSSIAATDENVDRAITFIDRQEGNGGTNLLPALQSGLDLQRTKNGLSRSIIVVTDGYVNVEAEAFDLIRNNLDKTNVFAFGIGSSVNRHLIEGLAHVGHGKPFIVLNEQESAPIAEQFRRYIATPVLANIQAEFTGFDAFELEPSTVPDVFSERPVILLGKWRGEAKGEILLKGKVGNKTVAMSLYPNQASPDDRNAAIKYLWARERIRLLSDYNYVRDNSDRKRAITELGLQYNLLTAFTSFIAIDEVMANNGEITTVKQPVPMPQGVSDLAIGFDLGISGTSGQRNSAGGLILSVALGFLTLAGAWKLRKWFHQQSLFAFIGMMLLGATSCKNTQVVTCEGDSVTFLLGADRSSNNPYFRYAADYFCQDSIEKTALLKTDCHDLKSVHDFLATHKPAKGPWRHVNLVVHGNEWTGMNVPIDSKEGGRADALTLGYATQQGVFSKMPKCHFDGQTQLSVFACNIGRDTALVSALSRAFNGIKAVSPPYFNIFEKAPGADKVQRHIADYSFVVFPAGSFPGNNAIAAKLATRYPRDTTNWLLALQRLHPRFPGDSYVHYFSIPVEWTAVYSTENARPNIQTEAACLDWVRSQPELMAEIGRMGMAPEQFRWKMEAGESPGNFLGKSPAIIAEGRAIIYCVLKPV